MVDILRPDGPEQALEVMRWAAADGVPLQIAGRGGKHGLGRPVIAEHRLEVSALAGITLYEPEELVLSAGAGTSLSEIEGLLAQNNQQLAFEPPDHGALLGDRGAEQSLGGVIACNLAGPRRLKAGAARDHFLGFDGISGRGEAIKSGGRVVKNVTGYDLCKLMAASYGTLAVLTAITVKVLPAPEKIRTVLLFGQDDVIAIAALSQAMGSPHEVSAAAHLPAAAAARSSLGYVNGAGAAVSAVRIEGPGPSVEHRCAALRELWGRFGALEELHGHNSRRFWTEVRDVAELLPMEDRLVWKVSMTPSLAGDYVARLAERVDTAALYDWAGGLVWLSLPAAPDGHAPAVRGGLDGQGHATLIRAPADLRARVPVFHPEAEAQAGLSGRIKDSFDPRGILNPGRMVAGR